MVKPLVLQPSQMTSTPRGFPRKDTTVLEHEGAHLLAMHAQRLDCSRAGANEVAHRLVALVGHPHRSELASPQELGERYRIAAVCLHPVTRLSWDERGCHDCTGKLEHGDEQIQAIDRKSVV